MPPEDDPPPEPDWLDAEPHPELDPPDAVDRVIEVANMMAVFAADRLRNVAALYDDALADPTRYGGGSREIIERSVRLELASALRITEYAAGELLSMADAVVHRYPDVLASLSRARMTEQHAKVLVAAFDLVEPQLRDDLLPEAIQLAETQPVGSFRRRLAKRIDTARASTLDTRYAEALIGRRLAVEPAADGMSWLSVYLPSVEAQAAFGRVTAMAKALRDRPEEKRTLDQIRADIAADLLIEGAVAAHPKAARGVRAQVVVTVPVQALLADGAVLPEGCEPPVVEGVGPIPVARARELCGGESRWMRVLTHPETGMVLSVGRRKYVAPKSLQRLTRWRADTCTGPGCGVPAERCQIDHQLDWARGGMTSLENNAPMCQGHHTVKHHGGWVVRQLPDSGGVIEWISPTGRRYLVEPERRVPVFAPVASLHGGVERAPF
jgi:hypothetical protein